VLTKDFLAEAKDELVDGNREKAAVLALIAIAQSLGQIESHLTELGSLATIVDELIKLRTTVARK
jgi:hypothetical protein